MNQHHVADSHNRWLHDIEYRREFGAENAKLEVAAALVDARDVAGITQAGLAEREEVSQAYIAKLERGDANPTIGHIGRLFACMWLKPSIGFAPIEPLTSFESVFIESQSGLDLDITVTRDDSLAVFGSSSVELPGAAAWTLGTE